MWKYLIAWFVMLLVSVANGALRQFTFGKYLDEKSAHQISTVIGIFLLGIVIRAYVRRYPPDSGRQALLIGLLWMALTVAFEFLFFHYVGGRSWSELLANYNLFEGRVWVAVLAWVAIAPYLFFRLKSPGR
jgi:predicted membrane-bound spermidine synthase